MPDLTILFIDLAFFACVIGAIVYVLRLLGQIARAQERTAVALEIIARRLEGGSKL
jgi:hypothetical protein